MNVDDIVKLTLVFAVSFSIIGISIQIIRLFNSVLETAKQANAIIKTVGTLVSKVADDYDYISEQIKMILDAFSKFSNGVINPLGKMFGIFSKFGGMGNRPGKNNNDSRKNGNDNKSNENDDEEENY